MKQNLYEQTIEYKIYKSDNKYWKWLDLVKLLSNGNIDLQTCRRVFASFIENQFDFVVISKDLKHILVDYDKLDLENNLEDQEQIDDLKKYLITYKTVIKGANQFDMKIKDRECIIELGKTKKVLAETQSKLDKLCEKLGIDPNTL